MREIMPSLSQVRRAMPASGIRQLKTESAEVQEAIHLEIGEPNFDTASHIREAGIRAIEEGYTHYTPGLGLPEVREACSESVNRRFGWSSDPTQIALTVGATNGIGTALLAVADPNQEVLIPDPGFPNYELMLTAQQSVPVRYRLDAANGFHLDFDELERKVSPRTSAILVNSPANPSGTVFTLDELTQLYEFACTHDLMIVSDEVYDELIFEGDHQPLRSLDNDSRVISAYSFSKTYAMTGWRIGFTVAAPEITDLFARIMQTNVTCASAVSQKAAEAALTGPQGMVTEMRDAYEDRRDAVCDLFDRQQVPYVYPHGAFYVLVDLASTGLEGTDLARKLLATTSVATAPGGTFGAQTSSMVRISLATEKASLLEGVGRIADFAKRRHD